METGDGRPSPGPQPEAPKFKYEGTKTKFEPSFLAEKPEDILKIKDRTLRRKVHMLHSAFVEDPNILTPDELRAEAKAIRQGIETKTFKSQEADPVWKKLSAQAKKEEEKTKQKPDTPFSETDQRIREAKAVGKGVLEGEIAEAVINQGAKAVRGAAENLRGRFAGARKRGGRSEQASKRQEGTGSSSNPASNRESGGTPPGNNGNNESAEAPKGENFRYLQTRILELAKKRVSETNQVERAKLHAELVTLQAKRDAIYNQAEQEGLFDGIRAAVAREAKRSNWETVADNVRNATPGMVADFYSGTTKDEEYKGLPEAAVAGAATEISYLGLRRGGFKNGVWDEAFLRRHGQDIPGMMRMGSEVDYGSFLTLPQDIMGLVDFDPRQQRSAVGSTGYREAGGPGEQTTVDQETMQEQMNRILQERMRGASQIPPKEIVALFNQGRYGIFNTEWAGKVEFLDVTKEDDRKRWILLNMAVFNDGTLPNPAMRWNQISETWLGDLKDAARLAKVDRDTQKEIDESYKDMVAVMAVSSSARAMEVSEGDPNKYGAVLSGSNEKPILGIQDTIGSQLLHAHPEKLSRITDRFSLIGAFYERVLEDAGITAREWGNGEASRITLIGGANENSAADAGLAYYLEKGHGGFDGYIDHILNDERKGMKNDSRITEALASGITERELWSMSKIACDMFFDDKFSRWNYLMNMKGWNNELKPIEDFGGDPLRVILEPSFLPKEIKKVYQSSRVLQLIDFAFSPQDIFWADDLPNLPQINKDELKKAELTASMATHFKFYMRFAEAVGNVIGSSQAGGIADWSDRSMEGLASVPELLNQVYGGFKLSQLDARGRVVRGQRDEENPDRTGKEIVGAMVARVVLAKAQALAELSAEPSLRDTFNLMVKESDTRDPYEKILQFLWGPQKDGKAGFLFTEASSRLELVIDERNRFGASEDLAEAKRILETRSQTPQGQNNSRLIAAGRAVIKITSSLNDLRGKR